MFILCDSNDLIDVSVEYLCDHCAITINNKYYFMMKINNKKTQTLKKTTLYTFNRTKG